MGQNINEEDSYRFSIIGRRMNRRIQLIMPSDFNTSSSDTPRAVVFLVQQRQGRALEIARSAQDGPTLFA